MVQDNKTKKALAAAEEALEDAIRQQSMLQSQCHQSISEIVHDIKNPLSAMIGYLTLINNEVAGPLGNDSYKDYIGTLDKSANRLHEICNSLLDDFASEDGKKTAKKTVKISALVHEVRDLFAAKAKAHEVVFDAQVSSKFPDIKANPQEMYRVLTNLVSNSIKFTPKGGRVSIQADIDENDGSYLMVVRDSGVGMSKDQIKQVIKSKMTTVSPHGDSGTGQGLAIVNRIIRDLGGKMEIISTENRGTRVKLWFPKKATVSRKTSKT